MHKNIKFIFIKFSNIKIGKKLSIYFIFLMFPVYLAGMEDDGQLFLRRTKHENQMPWVSIGICEQVLQIPQASSKGDFYRSFKRPVKTLVQDPLVSNLASNDPFYGVGDLWKDFSGKNKLSSAGSCCGVTNTSSLNLNLIMAHVENYTNNTLSSIGTHNDHQEKQRYLAIRKDIMRFFSIHVRRAERNISPGDLVAPIGCSGVGIGCCAIAGKLSYVGYHLVALNYMLPGALATLCTLGVLYNMVDEDGIRCQHFCTPQKDAERLSALRKVFENAYQHHCDLQSE